MLSDTELSAHTGTGGTGTCSVHGEGTAAGTTGTTGILRGFPASTIHGIPVGDGAGASHGIHGAGTVPATGGEATGIPGICGDTTRHLKDPYITENATPA